MSYRRGKNAWKKKKRRKARRRNQATQEKKAGVPKKKKRIIPAKSAVRHYSSLGGAPDSPPAAAAGRTGQSRGQELEEQLEGSDPLLRPVEGDEKTKLAHTLFGASFWSTDQRAQAPIASWTRRGQAPGPGFAAGLPECVVYVRARQDCPLGWFDDVVPPGPGHAFLVLFKSPFLKQGLPVHPFKRETAWAWRVLLPQVRRLIPNVNFVDDTVHPPTRIRFTQVCTLREDVFINEAVFSYQSKLRSWFKVILDMAGVRRLTFECFIRPFFDAGGIQSEEVAVVDGLVDSALREFSNLLLLGESIILAGRLQLFRYSACLEVSLLRFLDPKTAFDGLVSLLQFLTRLLRFLHRSSTDVNQKAREDLTFEEGKTSGQDAEVDRIITIIVSYSARLFDVDPSKASKTLLRLFAGVSGAVVAFRLFLSLHLKGCPCAPLLRAWMQAHEVSCFAGVRSFGAEKNLLPILGSDPSDAGIEWTRALQTWIRYRHALDSRKEAGLVDEDEDLEQLAELAEDFSSRDLLPSSFECLCSERLLLKAETSDDVKEVCEDHLFVAAMKEDGDPDEPASYRPIDVQFLEEAIDSRSPSTWEIFDDVLTGDDSMSVCQVAFMHAVFNIVTKRVLRDAKSSDASLLPAALSFERAFLNCRARVVKVGRPFGVGVFGDVSLGKLAEGKEGESSSVDIEEVAPNVISKTFQVQSDLYGSKESVLEGYFTIAKEAIYNLALMNVVASRILMNSHLTNRRDYGGSAYGAPPFVHGLWHERDDEDGCWDDDFQAGDRHAWAVVRELLVGTTLERIAEKKVRQRPCKFSEIADVRRLSQLHQLHQSQEQRKPKEGKKEEEGEAARASCEFLTRDDMEATKRMNIPLTFSERLGLWKHLCKIAILMEGAVPFTYDLHTRNVLVCVEERSEGDFFLYPAFFDFGPAKDERSYAKDLQRMEKHVFFPEELDQASSARRRIFEIYMKHRDSGQIL